MKIFCRSDYHLARPALACLAGCWQGQASVRVHG